MASTENRGLTAREAVLTYCTSWTQAAYRNCWPSLHKVAPDATTEEKKAACLAAARELMAMLKHEVPEQDDTASASEPMREPAVLPITGDLGSDSEPDIMAGGFLGTYGQLDIDTAGHWTYRASEPRLREINENGPYWFINYDRFFVTREDGSVQTLTIALFRRCNEEVNETKTKMFVGYRVPAETFGENNEPDLRLATERDLTRKLPDPDQFDGPAPVPLWVEGQLGVNQPLVRLTFDDIRNTEFDIEDSRAFGDGREFFGLRFSTVSSARTLSDQEAPTQSGPTSQSDVVDPKDEAAGANALGRPSLQTEIEKACNELITNNKAILDSRKPNYEPIRQIIRRERKLPSKAYIRGLSDEAIRKYIAPILDEAKAASHKLSQKL